jgi:hypothetical protein
MSTGSICNFVGRQILLASTYGPLTPQAFDDLVTALFKAVTERAPSTKPLVDAVL